MIDREKIIRGVECCLGGNDCDVEPRKDCPYNGMCLCATVLEYELMELLEKQEPKTGYWVNGHCSCCGEDIASKLDTWTNVQSFYFCPTCGSKMIDL